MYLKNRIIFLFLFLYFVLSFIFFLPFSSYQSISFLFSLISFCFRWFRFISFSFRWFRFVSFRFCWFRFVSFRFRWFRFVSFRFYFVSHFIGTHITFCILYGINSNHSDIKKKGGYILKIITKLYVARNDDTTSLTVMILNILRMLLTIWF